MKKIVVKTQHTLTLQKTHELATLFIAFGNDGSSPSSFEMFCKDAIKRFGIEGCGMHEENGYTDYTDYINKATHFLCEHYQAKGVIEIHQFDEPLVELSLDVFSYDTFKA